MSELVDWSSPAPATEGASNEGGEDRGTDSNQGNSEPENKGDSAEAKTREVGLPKESKTPVDDRKKQESSQDSGRDTDTKRSDIQEPKEETGRKPSAPRLINVNGEMITESELVTRASKVSGSDKRFEEAASVRKQQQAFLDQLKSDPMAVLSDSRIDIDRKALAEKWLMDELERESQDPRDARLKEYETKEAEAAKQEEQRVVQEKQAEFQRQIDQKKTEVADVIHKAMENTKLSKNPQIASQVLREMAMYMRSAKQQGVDLTPDELVQHVESSRYTGYHTLANSLEGEELIDFLGKDVIKKIRSADLKRLRGKGAKPKSPSSSQPSTKKREKSSKTMDPYEAMRKAGL